MEGVKEGRKEGTDRKRALNSLRVQAHEAADLPIDGQRLAVGCAGRGALPWWDGVGRGEVVRVESGVRVKDELGV